MSTAPATGSAIAAPVFWGSVSFVFLNFSLPIYTRQLGADAVQIGGMFTAFTVTMLVVRPAVGWALDRFGRRFFFAASFVFYALAMSAFSAADDLVGFYLARFVQGIGASLMWVSARTIVTDVTSEANRGQEMGRLTQRSVQGSMFGAFFGFTLIGAMPMAQAWQISFAGYAICALVGAAWALRLPETRAEPRREASRTPLKPAFLKLLVVLFVTGLATALIEPIYLIFLQDRFDVPMIAIAFAFVPAGVIYAVLPRHGGRLADRFGRPRMMALGKLAGAAVAVGIPLFPNLLWVAAFYALFAAGGAIANPAETAMLGDMTDAHTRGRLFGFSEAATALGAALGPLIGGALYEYARPEFAFAADGVLLIIAAGLTWLWFRPGHSEPAA